MKCGNCGNFTHCFPLLNAHDYALFRQERGAICRRKTLEQVATVATIEDKSPQEAPMETKTSMGRGKGLLNSAKWHRIQQVVRTNPLETPITSLVQVLNHLITELPNTSKSTSDKAEALAQLQAVLKLAIEHPAESEFLATLLHYTGHAAYVDGYTRGCTEAARE